MVPNIQLVLLFLHSSERTQTGKSLNNLTYLSDFFVFVHYRRHSESKLPTSLPTPLISKSFYRCFYCKFKTLVSPINTYRNAVFAF